MVHFPFLSVFKFGGHPARGLLNLLSAHSGLMAKEQSREESKSTASSDHHLNWTTPFVHPTLGPRATPSNTL